MKKNKLTIWIFFTPDVHRITNSLSCICFKINIIKANKNERGINLGAIPNKFNIEYLKYVETKYPFSTIKSKKLTALTVKAINESPNKIIKKFFMISIVKFW